MLRAHCFIVAILTGLLGIVPASAAGQSTAPDAAAIKEAHELLLVLGADRETDGILNAMRKSLSEMKELDKSEAGRATSSEFDAMLERFESYKDDMMSELAALYAERFSIAEMRELKEFYLTGVGKKIVEQTPELLAKGTEIGARWRQRMRDEMSGSGGRPRSEQP
jgi:hypothetical protein